MRKIWGEFPPWARYVAASAFFALAYLAARQVTFSHWNVVPALEISALLLVPRRYWPALLVGEEVPLLIRNIQCLPQFGWAWALFMSATPTVALFMPVIVWLRRWLPGRERPVSEHMGGFIALSLITASIGVARAVGQYNLGPLDPTDQPLDSAMVGYFFLGWFLPVLAFVPLVLAIREAAVPAVLVRWRSLWGSWGGGALMLSLVVIAMTIYGHRAGLAVGHDVQMALFVPVALAAAWLGWIGTASIGALASTCIVLLMPMRKDLGTVEAQTLMAFALTTLLMLGARTSALRQALRVSQTSLARARQELYLNEIKMRYGATGIEQELVALHRTHSRLLHRLRHFLHASDESHYRAEIIEARQRFFRLAESLSPREWLRIGDPSTLWTGSPLVEALESVGIAYYVEPNGELGRLAQDVNLALYRLGCEAVTYALNHMPTDRVRVRINTRELLDGRWEVELTVDSDGHPVRTPTRDHLLKGLGATGLSLDDMRGRTALFDGQLVVDEPTPTSLRIRMWLRDSPAHQSVGIWHPRQAPL